MTESYSRIIGSSASFPELVYRQKKQVLNQLFGVEIRRLSQALTRLARQDRYACELTRSELTKALEEITACLPIYRTYIQGEEVSQRDRRYLQDVFQEARDRSPSSGAGALDFLERMLLGDWPRGLTQEQGKAWRHFVEQWQQFTGPVMAKGLEDTSLYIYNALISLNEVGGTPTGERLSVEKFHRHNAFQQLNWPHTLSATSTHDTKHSEDARARINVLSEMPEEWERHLRRWS